MFVAVSSPLADFVFLPEWEQVSPARAQSSGLAFFQQTEETSDIQAEQRTSDAKLISPDVPGLLWEAKAFLEDLALKWFPVEFSSGLF